MKEITLKTIQMTIRVMGEKGRLVDKVIPFDYADTLLVILDTPPRDGFKPSTMRERLAIADRIEKAQAESTEGEPYTVLLEDAQHKKLSELVGSYPGFRVLSYGVLEFIDAVQGAPSVDVEAVE